MNKKKYYLIISLVFILVLLLFTPKISPNISIEQRAVTELNDYFNVNLNMLIDKLNSDIEILSIYENKTTVLVTTLKEQYEEIISGDKDRVMLYKDLIVNNNIKNDGLIELINETEDVINDINYIIDISISVDSKNSTEKLNDIQVKVEKLQVSLNDLAKEYNLKIYELGKEI